MTEHRSKARALKKISRPERAREWLAKTETETETVILFRPFRARIFFGGDVDPGRRGVPLALGCYVPALQAEDMPGTPTW